MMSDEAIEVSFDGEIRFMPILPDGLEWYKTVVGADEVDEINQYNDGYTPLLKAGDPILKVRKMKGKK